MNQALHNALYVLFRPIVRILYRKGVPYGEVALIVKRAFVDVVAEELPKDGLKPTTSRIAVTSGLTRKDVANLRSQDAISTVATRQYSRVVRILSAWMTDPEFQNSEGNPATLPRQGQSGSFDALIQKHSGDMLPRAALDELMRVGAASQLKSGDIAPKTDAYLADGDEDEGLSILGQDVALLISTIDHNLSGAEERRYQRKVSYNNLPLEAIPEFKVYAEQENQKLLVKLNDWLALHDRDSNPEANGTGRMAAGVGVYYFEHPHEESNNDR